MLTLRKLSFEKESQQKLDQHAVVEVRGTIFPTGEKEFECNVIRLHDDFELISYNGRKIKMANINSWKNKYKRYNKRRVRVVGNIMNNGELVPLKIYPDDDFRNKVNIFEKLSLFGLGKQYCNLKNVNNKSLISFNNHYACA